MNSYEAALQKAADMGYRVIENCHFQSDALGLISKHTIGLSDKLETSTEKRCVLVEEMAHGEISFSNILDMTEVQNRKEELKARRRCHDDLIGPERLADAVRSGCQSLYEVAAFLDVTERLLIEAIVEYKSRYGLWLHLADGDVIFFEPLAVYRNM
ncbi:MAG: hypothetical protein IJ315_09320 [Firmicutes bacterium]|nr:hypothetical protein [Bacillota bacterium]